MSHLSSNVVYYLASLSWLWELLPMQKMFHASCHGASALLKEQVFGVSTDRDLQSSATNAAIPSKDTNAQDIRNTSPTDISN